MARLLSVLVQCRVMLLYVFVVGIGSAFPFGFHISVINAPSMYIKSFINETWLDRYDVPVPDETLTLLWSSIVSIYSLGGLLGSLMCGYLIGKYGKRRCQQCNNLLIIGASLIIGFSKMAGSFEMILIGRFLYGVTTGLSLNVCVQYLGEISPKKLRGFTNTTAPIFVTLGKVSGQIFGLSEVLSRESLWPVLVSFCGVMALVQLLMLPFFPETPPCLLMEKNDKEGCLKAMKKLWGEGDHQSEIEDMLKELSTRKNTKIMSLLELIRDRSLRMQLYIMAVLMITMQLSGVNAIYFYSYDVFRAAGFSQDRLPYLAIGVGACESLATLLCSFFIDRFGRKVLLLSGYGLMALCLGFLTVTLSFLDWYPWIPYCSVALIFVYILFFGMGPSGITISVCIEIFTQSARASAFVLIGSLNWVGLYLIGMLFPYVAKSLGPLCFLFFLGFILASVIFLFLLLPETKGKSITEIGEEFNSIRCGQICRQGPKESPLPEQVVITKF